MPGSVGEAPAVPRASRDSHGELFGEGAENSGRGARAPHYQFAFQNGRLLLILLVTDADRNTSL